MTIGLQAYLQGYMCEKQAVEPTSEDVAVNDPARLEHIRPAPDKINLKDILPGGAATKGEVSSRSPVFHTPVPGVYEHRSPSFEKYLSRGEELKRRVAEIGRIPTYAPMATHRRGNPPPPGQDWRLPPGSVWDRLLELDLLPNVETNRVRPSLRDYMDATAQGVDYDWDYPGVSNYNTDILGERGERSPLPIQHSLEKVLRGQGGNVTPGFPTLAPEK